MLPHFSLERRSCGHNEALTPALPSAPRNSRSDHASVNTVGARGWRFKDRVFDRSYRGFAEDVVVMLDEIPGVAHLVRRQIPLPRREKPVCLSLSSKGNAVARAKTTVADVLRFASAKSTFFVCSALQTMLCSYVWSPPSCRGDEYVSRSPAVRLIIDQAIRGGGNGLGGTTTTRRRGRIGTPEFKKSTGELKAGMITLCALLNGVGVEWSLG